MAHELERIFPRLKTADYPVTSPLDRGYNCMAWAVGDASRWWWPEDDPNDGYWPPGVPRKATRTCTERLS
jgi:hypothetical protein